MSHQDWTITNATLVLPDKIQKTSSCVLSKGKIQDIVSAGEEDSDLLRLNIHGLQVFPGLINGHDSLLASYLTVPAANRPYVNWLSWDNEVKSSLFFKDRMLLETEQLYLLGSFKNLVSGATTVIDHIPEQVRKPFVDKMPVHLLADYGIAHSLCTYSLNWGESIQKEHKKAVSKNLPFILHIAEGFDTESRQSLGKLDELGLLDEHTVLVHGLSLDSVDLDRIAAAGAHIVWCPKSNLHIYNKTAPIKEMLKRGINVSLGTDAAMYGSSSLLAELKSAAEILGPSGETPSLLTNMVTRNPSRAFRLKERGVLERNAAADLFVLRGKYPADPGRSLLEADWKDVFLVVREGVPVYGDESLESLFTEMGVVFDRIAVKENRKIIQSGFKKLMESITASAGRSINFEFLPVT